MPLLPATIQPALEIQTHCGQAVAANLKRLEEYFTRRNPGLLSRHPAWTVLLAEALRHDAYCLEACEAGETRGYLGLVHVRSLLFGRFLVSMPYLNYGGVLADDDRTARVLIDRAAALADGLDVRYLELRHQRAIAHARLAQQPGHKIHMYLPLPETVGLLWETLPSKVRNQVRKGQKGGLSAVWGGEELLDEFYAVFSHNMRDLGTPVYGRKLFAKSLECFPERAEFCVVRAGLQVLAGALVFHGWDVSEVPSASSLRAFNHTNANMLMYWHLLSRAVERGQETFDFGRSSPDSSTYRFKAQWGAMPAPAEWQHYIRSGNADDLRPSNPKYGRMIRLWKRLPVRVTRWFGPRIVRGIP
jgi:FemAB-related protein (PEP-CTERM system-associated)